MSTVDLLKSTIFFQITDEILKELVSYTCVSVTKYLDYLEEQP